MHLTCRERVVEFRVGVGAGEQTYKEFEIKLVFLFPAKPRESKERKFGSMGSPFESLATMASMHPEQPLTTLFRPNQWLAALILNPKR